jgi:putative phosphoribosyl transferase
MKEGRSIMIFNSREHAATLLAKRLSRYKGKNPLVLGIPRGAVPMAAIIADALGGDLDVVLVRKLRYPQQPELAIGAIDESGRTFLADYASEVDQAYLEGEKKEQLQVICLRRELYTPGREPIDPRGRIVIVVDDGIATGSTMIAALRAIRAAKPKKIVAAFAVAPPQSARALSRECDEIACLDMPAEFYAVGQFFRDFAQVSDEAVMAILQEKKSQVPAVA